MFGLPEPCRTRRVRVNRLIAWQLRADQPHPHPRLGSADLPAPPAYLVIDRDAATISPPHQARPSAQHAAFGLLTCCSPAARLPSPALIAGLAASRPLARVSLTLVDSRARRRSAKPVAPMSRDVRTCGCWSRRESWGRALSGACRDLHYRSNGERISLRLARRVFKSAERVQAVRFDFPRTLFAAVWLGHDRLQALCWMCSCSLGLSGPLSVRRAGHLL